MLMFDKRINVRSLFSLKQEFDADWLLLPSYIHHEIKNEKNRIKEEPSCNKQETLWNSLFELCIFLILERVQPVLLNSMKNFHKMFPFVSLEITLFLVRKQY